MNSLYMAFLLNTKKNVGYCSLQIEDGKPSKVTNEKLLKSIRIKQVCIDFQILRFHFIQK